MDRGYKQVADGPPAINTHLIRQKKDFSCTQSDGEDSERGQRHVSFKGSLDEDKQVSRLMNVQLWPPPGSSG